MKTDKMISNLVLVFHTTLCRRKGDISHNAESISNWQIMSPHWIKECPKPEQMAGQTWGVVSQQGKVSAELRNKTEPPCSGSTSQTPSHGFWGYTFMLMEKCSIKESCYIGLFLMLYFWDKFSHSIYWLQTFCVFQMTLTFLAFCFHLQRAGLWMIIYGDKIPGVMSNQMISAALSKWHVWMS